MSSENIVKKVCKELGITQKELAEMLGVNPSAVSQWNVETPKMAEKTLELLLENHKLKKDLKEIIKAHRIIHKYLDVKDLDS